MSQHGPQKRESTETFSMCQRRQNKQKSAGENGRRESVSQGRPTEKPPELLICLTISPCPAGGSTGNGKFGWF